MAIITVMLYCSNAHIARSNLSYNNFTYLQSSTVQIQATGHKFLAPPTLHPNGQFIFLGSNLGSLFLFSYDPHIHIISQFLPPGMGYEFIRQPRIINADFLFCTSTNGFCFYIFNSTHFSFSERNVFKQLVEIDRQDIINRLTINQFVWSKHTDRSKKARWYRLNNHLPA